MDAISVLIVDTNETFLRIAARVLCEYYEKELVIVGTSTGEADALHQVQVSRPDIVLVGLSHHSLVNLRLIPHIRALLPQVGIIVLGSLNIRAYSQAAMDAGADAFVAQVALTNALLPAIWRITRRFHPQGQHVRVIGQHPDAEWRKGIVVGREALHS